MTKAERVLLETLDRNVAETHAVTKKNCAHLEYLLNDIQVNGEKGLQKILVAQHNQVDELAQRMSIVWRATDKIRTKTELLHSLKRYVEKRKWMLTLWKVLFGKIMKRLAIGFIALIASLIGADAIISMVSKVIKWCFELIK
jgi:uncharacterized coiled-coil protein SlyX